MTQTARTALVVCHPVHDVEGIAVLHCADDLIALFVLVNKLALVLGPDVEIPRRVR
jgi:hypothetical protein